MIRAVFIDIDNTLLDFDAYVRQTMREGFEKFGLGAYDEGMFSTFLKINNQLWGQIEQGQITMDELMQVRWNRIFAALGIRFDGVRFEDYFRDCLFESAIPVEYAPELLAYLQKKYILCAASNGPYAQQINRLERGGMLGCFSGLFISSRVGAAKPSPVFFNRCLKELNAFLAERGEAEILPSEIMMLGDSLSSDMAGAIGMGMKTCYFDRSRSGDTRGMHIDHVVFSLREVQEFL